MRRASVLAVLALVAGLVVATASPAAAATTHWVNDDEADPAPPGTSCDDAGYTTIQAAVDAAAAGDTVRVCPGTYPENVRIETELDLKGAGGGMSVVDGSGTSGPIIEVDDAGTVRIEHLTVDGMSLMEGPVVWGIRYSSTNGEIRDTEVLNIRNPSGSSQGIGIGVLSGGPGGDVRIRRNLLENWTRAGIFVDGVGTTGRVDRNTVIGPEEPRVWGPNGIQISRGAEARVTRNDVRGADFGGGSGILLFCAGPTEVRHNGIRDSDKGIGISDTQDSTVRHNEIRGGLIGIELTFLGLFFGELGCPNEPDPTPTRDNEVRHNDIRDVAEHGIAFTNQDPLTSPGSPLENRVRHNTIREAGENGIFLQHGSDNTVEKNDVRQSGENGIHATSDTSGNLFDKNRIRDSGDFDARDDSSGDGTAGTANLWVKNRCDTSSPPGLC